MFSLRVVRWGLVGLILAGAGRVPAQTAGSGTKRALLVGINTYQPATTTAKHPNGCRGGRCELPGFPNLNGPLNDVVAMRDLLSSPKFGFAPQNIAVLTNPERRDSKRAFDWVSADKTNHDALLTTMKHYLVDVPKQGDTVVFYYAGHGSLRVNSKGVKLAMMVDGKPSHADSTLVPADAWTGIHDVRDRQMTEIFNAALDKGVLLTVILDSCHSGSFTRGVELGPRFVERSLGYDPDDIAEAPPTLKNGDPVPVPTERKDNPALVFSAAQQDQTAKERVFGDNGAGTPHGAFTLALIKALESLPIDAPASDVYRQVRATIEGEGVGDQVPALDASKERLGQPLFGGMKSDVAKTRAAAIGVGDDGEVLLDAGQLAGFDVGSVFTSLATDDKTAKPIKLRVESLEGLTHSRAKVLSPPGAKVEIGQVFDLTNWIPRQMDALHVWTWPHGLSQAAVSAAAGEIKNSGVKLVEDPVEDPWTDMLAWNGSAWEMRHAAVTVDTAVGSSLSAEPLQAAVSRYGSVCTDGSLSADDKRTVDGLKIAMASQGSDLASCQTFVTRENGSWVIRHVEKAQTTSLGATLSASALKAKLGPGAMVWANLPPSQELYGKLALHESNSLVSEAHDFGDADYILAGNLTDEGAEWAWLHKPEYMAGPRAAVTKDHSPGCSTQSNYPVASDWVLIADADSVADGSRVLNQYSGLLGKVNGWLNLSSDLSGASPADYYSLEFKRVVSGTALGDGEAARQDERLKMFLKASNPVSEKRWVYVLDIDCHGKGSLLYPYDQSGNRFPNDADSPHELELPGAPILRIGAPFGVDTVLLISTQEPLPDPYMLNFEGVSQRGTRGLQTPLEQLLTGASMGGTRGMIADLPTNWSIETYNLRSVPKDGK